MNDNTKIITYVIYIHCFMILSIQHQIAFCWIVDLKSRGSTFTVKIFYRYIHKNNYSQESQFISQLASKGNIYYLLVQQMTRVLNELKANQMYPLKVLFFHILIYIQLFSSFLKIGSQNISFLGEIFITLKYFKETAYHCFLKQSVI